MKKHIYIYSPSGAVRDKAAFRRGVTRLKAMGHEVEIDEAALLSHQRFAGDDEARLAAIHRAASSGADVAMISRGGYGLTRLLPGIKYKQIQKAIEGGTRFVGLSDFTALQLAVLAKTGGITWAGPALGEDFGANVEGGEPGAGPDDIMQACFEDMLAGQGEGAGWRQSPLPASSASKSGAETTGNARSTEGFTLKKSLLWGGNLSLVSGLLGTPYFPQIKGGILFLEDVAEHPYRLERMLSQLLHAGVLARQKAIVLGQFTNFKLTPHDRGYKLETVVRWLRSQVKTPVVTNLPFGHVPTKVMLPVGANCTLSVEGRDALLFWGDAR